MFQVLCIVVFLAISVDGLSPSGRNVCRSTRVERFTANERYKTKCGFLGWKRCTRNRVVTRTRTATDYKCCASWVSVDNTHCDKAICFGQPAGACPNGGTCTRPGVCSCRGGFSRPRCSDINECASNNGNCGQKCLNTAGSYRCVCNTGFGLLPDRRTCKPVCFNQSPGVCNNGGTCVRPGKCTCRKGFSQPQCADINECATNNGGCSQLCDNLSGSYRCRCGRGFGMLSDQKTCKPVCHGSSPGQCPNKGTCTSPGICSCPRGFSAPKCDDINECNDNNNGGCNQVCNNTPGSYSCSCEAGYGLVDARICKPICFGGRPGTCPNGGKCLSPDRCSCKKGFAGSPCTDVNECAIGNGGCSQGCQNLLGSYKCTCSAGYSLSADGKTCKAVCQGLSPGTCPNGGTCIQPDVCECAVGYAAPMCEDLDECQSLNGGCSQQCQNLPGSFRCACSPGYRLDGNGKSCSDIDECAQGSAGCSHFCVNGPGTFNCDCPLGYTLGADDKTCVDVDECSTNNGGCSQICVNSEGSYRCDCQDGFVLDNDKKTCQDTSDCGNKQFVWCWPKCVQKVSSCECPVGHVLHADGVHCVDPCFIKPCEHSGVCSKPSAESTTFTCDCTDTGYEGDNCERGIVSLPASIRVRAGEQSDDITLTAFPERELIISAVVNEQVQVFPSRIFLRHPSSSVSFRVLAKERGKYRIDFEFSGPDSVAFPEVPFLEVIADDVFSKYHIPLKGLPQGSFFIDVSVNNYDYRFTSTSAWYRLNSNPNVFFTKGVTFSSAGNVSMPLSVTGLEVTVTDRLNIGPVSSLRNPDVGAITTGLVTRGKRQAPFQLSVQDINDFLNQNSILSTLFALLRPLLPPWIQFLVNQNSPQPFFFSQILPGSSVQQLTYCTGAPLFDDTMYHTFRFTHAIILSVLGQRVEFPATESEEYCIILDLNKDYGTTFVIMFPDKVADILKKISMFEKLQSETGFVVYPRGFGLSLFRKLNVRPIGSELEFWNGDEKFKYPLSKTATFWASLQVAKPPTDESTFEFNIPSTRVETYVSLPDIKKVLTHIFIEPWDLYLRGEASAIIRIKLFKKYYKIAIVHGGVQAYGSFGGPAERTYCGPTANPPGIFTSVFVEANLDIGLPVIQDLLFSADLEADLFNRFDDVDLKKVPSPLELLKSLVETIKEAAVRLLDFVVQQLVAFANVIAPVIISNIQIFQQHIQELIQLVTQFLNGFDLALIPDFANLIQNIVTSVNNLVDDLVQLADQLSMMFETALDEFVDTAKNETKLIKETALNMTQLLYNETVGILKGPQTMGVRGYFSMAILGMRFGIEGEFVKSDAHIRRCGRFMEFFEHMQGEQAWRAFGVLDGAPLSLGGGGNLWKFFAIRAGVGIEFALATESKKFVFRIHARLNFLGARASTDLIINNNGIHLVTEANIFNIFRVRLTVSATVFVSLPNWSLRVKGEFLPGGGRRRQAQKSLQASLWDAVRDFVNRLGDEAVKRIGKAQGALDKAKGKLTSAQNWLDEKKAGVDKANAAFDWVIGKLEVAKQKLEAAKGPFKRALEKLKAAQRDVDKLCRIKDCPKICVPGIKIGRCKIGWVRIPCPKFTKCMFKIPNVFCIAKNVLCRVLRGIAYVALEVAKIFVRIPMLALDLAKVAVSVAQIAVDKSRVVLEAVKLLFDLAKLALEAVKIGLDAAKLALEAVKFAVRAAQFALNFIIKYGLQSILDVGACGFEVELSTRDLLEFEVFCEVNPFRLGWKTVRFRLNFGNIISSIWNAAKALVKTFMKSIENVIGRRKRGLDYEVLGRLHKTLRSRRQAVNGTDTGADFDTIFDNLNDSNILTNGSLENDIEFWEEQCQIYDPVIRFLRSSLETLRNVTDEMELAIKEIEDRRNENIALLRTISTLTVEDSEIDYGVAQEDFNVSREEVQGAVNRVNSSLQEDELVRESKGAVEYSMEVTDEAAETISTFKILPVWKAGMENITLETFTSGECSGFYDCVIWSFSQLYQLFDSIDPSLIPAAQGNLPQLEELYYDLFDNDTRSVMEIKNVTNTMVDYMRMINADDIFCGTVPNITQGPENATVSLGSKTALKCFADSVPSPTYYWYKDGQIYMSGKSLNSLSFTNVSMEAAGKYVCSAGNHIANATSDPAYLSVVHPPKISALPTKLEVVVGSEVEVLCNVTSSPESTVQWYTTSESDISNNSANLLLPAVQVSHAGIYRCEAVNPYGSSASNPMKLEVKVPKPPCPKLTFNLGYITKNVSRSDGNSTMLIENLPDGMLLNAAYLQTVELITESTEEMITVQTGIQSSSFDLIVVEMAADCTATSECSAETCEEMFRNMSATLNDALAKLRAVVLSEEALFVLDGKVYYFNPSQFDVPQESRECPEGYEEKSMYVCVDIAQGYTGNEPKNFRVSQAIRFGSVVVYILRWDPPSRFEALKTSYIVAMKRRGGIRVVYRTSRPVFAMLLSTTDAVTTVSVRANTSGRLSPWVKMRFDPTIENVSDGVPLVLPKRNIM